ncbi:MAG: HipA domain-containing protein [bacterium]|nr:HipA domain-containing protein [bacterium]
MNGCLICGESIKPGELMHLKCRRSLFGVSYIPKLNFSLNDIIFEAQKMAGKLSISGVQPKLSMRLDRESKELVTVVKDGEFILKPQTNTFPELPENENLCMTIAQKLGIDTPPHTLLKLKDGSYAYLVKRFDRVNGKKINQEDFCQVLGKTTKDKYTGSIEQIANKLLEIAEFPNLDIQLLYERVLFSFIIGNGDAHLKNYSINYTSLNNIRLSPSYDMVSSKLLLPDEEDSALPINGKSNKLTINDFLQFSDRFNIPYKITERIISKKALILDLIKDSMLSPEFIQNLTGIVKERIGRLEKGEQ